MSEQNEELDLFRDMVLRFLEQEIAPHFEEWEKNHMMPREIQQENALSWPRSP